MRDKLKACAFVVVTCALALVLAACGQVSGKSGEGASDSAAAVSADSGEGGNASGDKPVVYTTFFPVYDLTSRIAGDKMQIEMIISGNQEPHDFEIKTSDMAKISQADLIVYNGAGMESFIPDMQDLVGDQEKFLDLSQGLTLLQGKDAVQGDHSSVNPHTWLSIRNAMVELDTIREKLSEMDPENADYYQQNYETTLAEFKALDQKFETELSKVPEDKRYFVVSHAAFNYLANDYGLTQVAVTGISPEDEPSASQLATIADFVKQHDISTIFFEGKATPKVAETLAQNTGAKTATIYTMESLSEDEMKMGYVKLMEENLDVLMESFSD